jgi:hypothetical protein
MKKIYNIAILLLTFSSLIVCTDGYASEYTAKESIYAEIYNDIDAKNPKFDVGGYCLTKEKQGGVSFEECIAVAAKKIMAR